MSLLAAALLLAAAAPVRADVKVFAVGDGMRLVQNEDTYIGSRDGYHLANLSSDGEKEYWEKDGVEFAHAPKGVFLHGKDLDWKESAAMSSDGKVLLHVMASRDPDGRAGVSAAVNGKRIGGVHAEILLLRVSPSGTNAAYAARDSSGWSVHSAQGVTPALPDDPAFLFVSDSDVLYLTKWQGRMWLYRNGVPSAAKNYTKMSASPDLKHVGGTYLDDLTHKFWVDIDGVPSGPWEDVGVPEFSEDGRHSAFLALKSNSHPYDTVVVDGAAKAIPDGSSFLLLDNAGIPYWLAHSVIDDSYTAYRDGVKLKPVDKHHNFDWAGFSPSGAHYAFWGTDRLVMDGKLVKAPRPGDEMRIVFDGETSFHYLSGQFELVCATVDGSSAEKTRCGKIGRALDKSAPLELLKAEPALKSE